MATPETVAEEITTYTTEQLNEILAYANATRTAPIVPPQLSGDEFPAPATMAVPAPAIPPIASAPSQAELISKRVAHAIATGGNPKQALRAALDADGDGKVGLRDIRVIRWMLVIFTAGIFIGTLIMNPGWPIWVATNHWPIVLAVIIASPTGAFLYWIFRPDVDKIEDKLIGYVDAGINNIL